MSYDVVTVVNSSPKTSKSAVFTASNTCAAIDLEGMTLMEAHIPSSFTGTTLTVLMSDDIAGTFEELHDRNGDPVSITVDVSTWASFGEVANILAGVRFIKLKSSATETATLVLSIRVL